MRLIALLALLLPSLALAQVTIGPGAHTGPRILGEASTEYCPMLVNGKCTDGKTVTTTRATPVPCGSGTAGVDVGCYDGGLNGHGQVTNYCTNSTDPAKWVNHSGVPVVTGPDASGWWTVADDSAASRAIKRLGDFGAGTVANGTYTSAVEAQPGTITRARLTWVVLSGAGTVTRSGGDCDSSFNLTLTVARWYTCTVTVAGADATTRLIPLLEVGDLAVTSVGSVKVRQAQVEKAGSMSRVCPAGATPATCDSDKHKRSSERFPVEKGQVSFLYRPGAAITDADSRFLVSASTFNVAGWEIYIRNGSSLAFFVHAGGNSIFESGSLTWDARDYFIRVKWGDGWVTFWRDGVQVGVAAMTRIPAGPLPVDVWVGSRSPSGATGHANGTISRLEWSTQ